MDSQLLTLSKIFSERLFRIPDYQRGYAWTERQLKDFWNDLDQLELGQNHYTGVLTLEEVPKDIYLGWEDDSWIITGRSFEPYYVVDGQQRLTTAIIAIQSIIERLPDGTPLNFTSKTDIQRRFIFESKDNGISRSYVFGYERDNPSYEYLKTKIFQSYSSTSSSEETIYTQNLAAAKRYFLERIRGFDLEALERLYRKITQQLLFNIFTISTEVDVCVAFETMNNRGKPLSSLELLKNRLIYLSLKFDTEECERSKLRRTINDCWKSVYYNLGRNAKRRLEDDHFLMSHYSVYFGTPSANQGEEVELDDVFVSLPAFFEFRENLLEHRFVSKNILPGAPQSSRVTVASVYEYASSLQTSAGIWFQIWNPLDATDLDALTQCWLDRVNRLLDDGRYSAGTRRRRHLAMTLVHSLLLALLLKPRDLATHIGVLKSLERALFVESLVGRNSPRLLGSQTGIVQLAVDLHHGKMDVGCLADYFDSHTKRLVDRPDFSAIVREAFASHGFYNWSSIRYFLFEYNAELQATSYTQRGKIKWDEFCEDRSDFTTIEHIYPQQAKHAYWTQRFSGLNQKRRNQLRDSLGNLLPLSTAKNSSLGNRPFPEKVDSSDARAIGYRYGSYAENEVGGCADWTPDEILSRGLKLLSFLETRWDVRLGTDAEKRSLLGFD